MTYKSKNGKHRVSDIMYLCEIHDKVKGEIEPKESGVLDT